MDRNNTLKYRNLNLIFSDSIIYLVIRADTNSEKKKKKGGGEIIIMGLWGTSYEPIPVWITIRMRSLPSILPSALIINE